jgi:hypothetical protein
MTPSFRRLLPRPALTAGLVLLFLTAACNKADAPPTPTASSAPPAAEATAPSGSVAAPTSSLPAPDASMPPAAPAGPSASGQSDSASQASPKSLDKGTESAQMPLPGQVNNHSVPQPIGEKR